MFRVYEADGEQVFAEIIRQIKVAKYFSISVNSTPDVTHIDQLVFIMIYFSPDGRIEERFVKFLPIQSHSAGLFLVFCRTWVLIQVTTEANDTIIPSICPILTVALSHSLNRLTLGMNGYSALHIHLI
uniref:Zinc finger MYMtype protein 1like [Aplysia californica] n=1 Tax=Lepeophtheirus salmonis TaxID=72036 RepID=A0A0K2UR18_LEPSM